MQRLREERVICSGHLTWTRVTYRRFHATGIRTSSITQHMWYMHCVMASLVPDMVTARSVELGSISEATWIEAPVTSRISLIFDPPLPMREPHWEAGTMSLRVIGGLVAPPPLWLSWNCEHHSSNFLHINVNALKIAFVGPVTVTIRSWQDPSEMLIFAPDWNQIVSHALETGTLTSSFPPFALEGARSRGILHLSLQIGQFCY